MMKMAIRKPTISAFFPFLNDWGTIGSLVATVDDVLARHAREYEILIIDDGSNAHSKSLLHILVKKFPKLRVITHERNRGYGGAVKSGIYNSKMDWVFYTDGDAQYNPAELERFILEKQPHVDIVNGYKIKRQDPWYRTVLGRIYHHVVKLAFGIPIRDTDCDFRLMKRSMFDKISLESNSGLICAEMIKKIADGGYVFQEIAVTHYWRTSGKSQFFNFARVGRVLIGMSFLWFRLVIQKKHLR